MKSDRDLRNPEDILTNVEKRIERVLSRPHSFGRLHACETGLWLLLHTRGFILRADEGLVRQFMDEITDENGGGSNGFVVTLPDESQEDYFGRVVPLLREWVRRVVEAQNESAGTAEEAP